MDQQLRLAEHLSTCVIGNTCVDTSVVWRHVSQHQGISSSILPLAQPGTVHQLGAVLDKQETGRATISLPWDMPAAGLTHPSWSSTSNTCCVPSPGAGQKWDGKVTYWAAGWSYGMGVTDCTVGCMSPLPYSHMVYAYMHPFPPAPEARLLPLLPGPTHTLYQVTVGGGLPSMTASNCAMSPTCTCMSSIVTCMDGAPGRGGKRARVENPQAS